jgi:hypothetical protein
MSKAGIKCIGYFVLNLYSGEALKKACFIGTYKLVKYNVYPLEYKSLV